MGKLFNALVLSGLVTIILFLFDGRPPTEIIGQLFFAPMDSPGSFLIKAITTSLGVATITGIGAVVIGSFLIRMDWLVRAGLFTILLGFVEAPFIAMWQFLGSKITVINNCVGSAACGQIVGATSSAGNVLAGLIMGPLVLYAAWACFNYIWSPESSG
jgi:hypothetical protein